MSMKCCSIFASAEAEAGVRVGVPPANTEFVRRMEILHKFIFIARNVESVGIVPRTKS